MKVPFVVEENNLSRAWAKVMLKLLSRGVEEISPLVVTVNLPQGTPVETPAIRSIIDEELDKYPKLFPCHTTANTIFPSSLWVPSAGRQALYDRYRRVLPLLKKCPNNRLGIYFERLIAYRGSINQLEHILTTWEKGNRRRSEFQATIVDPCEDWSDAPMHGFPCLRQVMFIPDEDGLVVSGVYGVQYAFDRAYGNYLGLCRLGEFMAHEMGLPLKRLQCVTTIAERGTPNKGDLDAMKRTLTNAIQQSQPTGDRGSGDLALEIDGVGLMDDLTLEEYAQTR